MINMKAEELKSKIQFESHDVGHNLAMIAGKLEVHAVMEYDQRAIEFSRDLDEIKERIREMIMRRIYDDQRHELYDALMELFESSPMDYSAMSAAREKILNAAKHSPIRCNAIAVVRGILREWEAEADLLKSGNHPRRQGLPRRQVLQEECALRGCIADIKRVLDASNG